MGIFRNIKNSILRVKYNFKDYFFSFILFQLIQSLLVMPSISFLFSNILAKSNANNLTLNNWYVLFTNPLSLIFLLLLLIIFVVAIFYEIGYYFILVDRQMNNQPFTIKDIFSDLNKKAKYFISFYSIFFLLYFAVISPLVLTGLNSTMTDFIKIPDFIVDELLMSTRGQVIYFSVIIVLSYIALRLLYSIYFFIKEEDCNIMDAVKKSIAFSKKKSIRNLIMISIAVFIYGTITLILMSLSLAPVLITDYLKPSLSMFTAGITLTLMQFTIFIASGVIIPFMATLIIESTGFYEGTIENKKVRVKVQKTKKQKILMVVSTTFILLLVALNTLAVVTIVYRPDTLIIGHRGYMDEAVENSLEGLRAAKKAGADYVELDIQETSDNKFIVIHDYNLRRLAKVNKSVKNMTLDELMNVEMHQNGHTAKIPSLEEFIDEAKKINIKLLIEIKPHGSESPEMEENFVKLLKDKKVEYKFLVQSLDKPVLDRVKEIDPKIKTGYIVPFLVGKIPDNPHDFLVLEDFSVTSSIISQIEASDKNLFVWTINEEALMQKYLKLDVEGLITNYPETALRLREEDIASETFINRVVFLLED